ncbi:hypothetical protein F2Q70_00043789 [Brassica cretica]|uniref:Uncharacterized protein n=1 Tax=Brassica cretica TaxID=69181 RepID=A0A8S9KJB2_BRACR|nr:hypothetical protein F2Q70_00043789 [Brassica cretica]
MVQALFLCPDRWGVELHPCEQDPSADSCRSFCQARSSPQQAVLLEFLHQLVIDVLPAQRQRIKSRKGKGVASENVLGNLPLPEWNPGFSPGERSGTSEVPLPSDFFADLPPGFTTHKSLDEESRRKVVAEGSSLINEGMRVFNAALDGSFRESRISHFKAEEAERELFRVAVELRFSNDHVYPPAGTIVSKVIMPSSAFFARLICACVPLGRLFISPGRAVGIQDEVFYASDLREVASEKFCG